MSRTDDLARRFHASVQCSSCGLWYGKRQDGTVRRHRIKRDPYVRAHDLCRGSLQPPKGAA